MMALVAGPAYCCRQTEKPVEPGHQTLQPASAYSARLSWHSARLVGCKRVVLRWSWVEHDCWRTAVGSRQPISLNGLKRLGLDRNLCFHLPHNLLGVLGWEMPHTCEKTARMRHPAVVTAP